MFNAPDNTSHLVAKTISQWGNPLIYSPLIFYLSAAAGGETVSNSIAYAAAATILIDVPVFVVIFVGLRRGRYQHWHVPNRKRRNEIYAIGGLSTALAFLCLYYIEAPRPLLATLLAVLISNLAGAAINRFWKISIHTGAITGAVTVMNLLFWPRMIWSIALIPLVAWSRVVLGEHTVVQVVLGSLFTAAITLFAFAIF